MPVTFFKRDVHLIIDSLSEVERRIDNLAKLQSTGTGRALAIANTHTQTARLFLQELASVTPEGE